MSQNMTESKKFRCVNCGTPSVALYKSYAPTVLKLTKCEHCKEIVDKYVEYDPVIVTIDLVLMSKEALRHVLYNTEFKSFWKLLFVVMILETYGVWRSDSLFTITVNAVCGIQNNQTHYLQLPLNLSMPSSWVNKETCSSWARIDKTDDSTDLFLWEKDFYMKFTSIFIGVVMFILTIHTSMMVLKPFSIRNVSPVCAVRAESLAHASSLLTLPALVWGADAAPAQRSAHHLLVQAYSHTVFVYVFTVVYSCPLVVTMLVVAAGSVVKYATSFHVTSYLNMIT